MKRLVQKQYSKDFLQKVCNFVSNKDKFKFKTAELDSDFIKEVEKDVSSLTIENNSEPILSLYNEIVEDCQDATFSGMAYRKFSFPLNIFSKLDTVVNEDNEECYIMKDLIPVVKSKIKTGDIQSCSKSLQACEEFIPEFGGIEAIINFECKNALDVMNVCNFYKQICEKEFNRTKDKDFEEMIDTFSKIYDEFKNEEEILAVIPNNYEVCEISDTPTSDLNMYILVDDV